MMRWPKRSDRSIASSATPSLRSAMKRLRMYLDGQSSRHLGATEVAWRSSHPGSGTWPVDSTSKVETADPRCPPPSCCPCSPPYLTTPRGPNDAPRQSISRPRSRLTASSNRSSGPGPVLDHQKKTRPPCRGLPLSNSVTGSTSPSSSYGSPRPTSPLGWAAFVIRSIRTTGLQALQRGLDASSMCWGDADLDQLSPTLGTPQQGHSSAWDIDGGGDSSQGSLCCPAGFSGLNDADNEGTVEVSADRGRGRIRPYIDLQSHLSHSGGRPPGLSAHLPYSVVQEALWGVRDSQADHLVVNGSCEHLKGSSRFTPRISITKRDFPQKEIERWPRQ